MGFLKGLGSKNLTILSSLVLVLAALYILALKSEIGKLRQINLELRDEVLTLKLSINRQNEMIKALELKNKKPPPKSVEERRVEKIYLKDKSCENELKAYKELFEKGEK